VGVEASVRTAFLQICPKDWVGVIDNHVLKGIPVYGLRPILVQVGLFVDSFGLAHPANAALPARAIMLLYSW
jgi:hypothetical protein